MMNTFFELNQQTMIEQTSNGTNYSPILVIKIGQNLWKNYFFTLLVRV